MAKYPQYEGYPHDPDFGNPAEPDLSNPYKQSRFEEFQRAAGAGNDPSGAGDATIKYEEYVEPAEKMIGPYYDQLLLDAKGDWDLVKKYLIQDFEFYLGKGDARMAAFIKTVASNAETKKGTIQYDYEVAKRRQEEDYTREMARLSEEEKAFKAEEKFEAERAKQARTGGYLERLGGAGTMAHGAIAKTEAEEEKARQFQLAAYNRYLKERREDLLRGKERGIEDITTAARRKIFESEKYGPGGERYEQLLREYEKETRPKTGTIAQERQETRQAYINWLAQADVKDVEAFLS